MGLGGLELIEICLELSLSLSIMKILGDMLLRMGREELIDSATNSMC
jgi:hypothetical protein